MRTPSVLRRALGALRPPAPQLRHVIAGGGAKAILFVSGPGGGARRYRCDHQLEQLQLAGSTGDVAYRDGLELPELADHYACVVLYRVPWDLEVARFLDAAHERGVRTLCDYDDLVFDPERSGLIRGLSRLSGSDRRAYEETIARLRTTLERCDGAVVSTDPLAAAAAEVNPAVVVAYNAVSAEMVARAEAARLRRKPRAEVTVAYLSGTDTHDRDFEEAADAVLWMLARGPHVRFVAVGFLALDARFDRYGERVVRLAYQPWERLPEVIAGIDVNLAPLEPGNAFTDSKSCLKYLEAALVGVPTVASPRPDFARAIRDGANGLLAEGEPAWRDALARLVDSADERERIGEAARRDVLDRHTTRARALETAASFSSLAAPIASRPPL